MKDWRKLENNMATLRQIQLAELDCLKEIDRICRANDISYSLAYGTMLGAVRHKGFIPWDDDLDIYMSLKEFRRFQKCFDSEHFFLQTERTDPEMPFIMYKVRKNNTCMLERGLERLNIHQGVWVDIFVYMDAAKLPAVKKIQHKLTIILRSFRCRTLSQYRHQENALQKVANHLPSSMALELDRWLVRMIEMLGSSSSGESIVFSNQNFRLMFFQKKYLENTAEYSFEGNLFPGVKDFDGYLSSTYGDDYMTPIRTNGHISGYEGVIC